MKKGYQPHETGQTGCQPPVNPDGDVWELNRAHPLNKDEMDFILSLIDRMPDGAIRSQYAENFVDVYFERTRALVSMATEQEARI